MLAFWPNEEVTSLKPHTIWSSYLAEVDILTHILSNTSHPILSHHITSYHISHHITSHYITSHILTHILSHFLTTSHLITITITSNSYSYHTSYCSTLGLILPWTRIGESKPPNAERKPNYNVQTGTSNLSLSSRNSPRGRWVSVFGIQ